MIIDKEVEVKIGSKNLNYYKNLGYIVNFGDLIHIKIEDLYKSCKSLVNVKCDVCGKIKKIEYRSYLKNVRNYPVYCCDTSCAKIKENQTKREIYGVDYEKKRVSKMKYTNKEKYGNESSSMVFRNQKDQNTFISQLKKIYVNDDFDYSKVEYINNYTDVEIICKKHGIFKKRPNELMIGYGCKKCNKEKRKEKIMKQHLEKSNLIHENKYDYSKTKYEKDSIEVTIDCPIHGEFKQRLSDHSRGKGCEQCANLNRRLKLLERINKNLEMGYQITPSYNEKACRVFDQISISENIRIQHAMNGGEYHIPKLGYWLDGYDEINNVAYEYDEKEHFINGELKNRDVNRQKEIEKFLGCKFVRIRD